MKHIFPPDNQVGPVANPALIFTGTMNYLFLFTFFNSFHGPVNPANFHFCMIFAKVKLEGMLHNFSWSTVYLQQISPTGITVKSSIVSALL